jgi:sigma-54-specific transcriptional regulator
MPVLSMTYGEGASPPSSRDESLVVEDPRSLALFERIRQVAPSNATVLVTGETGTGKELVARHIHELSRRKDQPFAAVNCGAFSEQLLESELFGHERGSFTGAQTARVGWFEAAHGGTLFLDEVGDLPPSGQVKLLRVLQECEVVRIGSRQPIAVDVRLIAATNVQLERAMAAGRFRGDLFYRLNVTTIAIPPLRERPGDILPLARFFLKSYGERLGIPPAELTESAERALVDRPWPGNVRELQNAIQHALLICRGGRIVPNDLRLVTPTPTPRSRAPLSANGLEKSLLELFERNLPNLFEHIEGEVMKAAFEYCEHNQLRTARLLGISRNVVRARLLDHGMLPGSSRRSPRAQPRSENEVTETRRSPLRDR